METNEAKKYLIENADYKEDDFELASDEDVACEFAKDGEWVCNYYVGYPINEHEMKTAIELAKDHKFSNNQKSIDSYVDFMLNTMNEN